MILHLVGLGDQIKPSYLSIWTPITTVNERLKLAPTKTLTKLAQMTVFGEFLPDGKVFWREHCWPKSIIGGTAQRSLEKTWAFPFQAFLAGCLTPLAHIIQRLTHQSQV